MKIYILSVTIEFIDQFDSVDARRFNVGYFASEEEVQIVIRNLIEQWQKIGYTIAKRNHYQRANPLYGENFQTKVKEIGEIEMGFQRFLNGDAFGVCFSE